MLTTILTMIQLFTKPKPSLVVSKFGDCYYFGDSPL